MKKKTAKKILKFFGVLYLISALALIGIGVSIIINVFPNFTAEMLNAINLADIKDIDPKNALAISLFISAFFNLIACWLLFRAAKNGKKSTFLLIIVVLSLFGSIAGLLYNGFNINSVGINLIISLVKDLFMLIVLMSVRKEN